MKTRFVIKILCFCIFCFCFSPVGVSSGNAKTEFEKVIKYYQDKGDEQKLKATFFLFENIDQHYSEDIIWMGNDSIPLNFDELKFESFEESLKAFQKLKDNYVIYVKYMEYYDKDSISAESLIHNIEMAFLVWKKPWNENLSFEEFCEYILPYRVSTEPLQNWRQIYYDRFYPVMNTFPTKNNYVQCALINENLKSFFNETYGLGLNNKYMPLLGPLNLLHRKQGECPDMVNVATYAMRSVGIPCCVDFTPYWATSSGGHFWNVTFNASKKPQIFMGVSHNPGEYGIPREVGKAYRMTYAKNKESLAMKAQKDEIPAGFLESPYLKDVTNEYVKTKDVAISVDKKNIADSRFSFFGVFNYSGWRILGWGDVEDTGSNIVVKYRELGVGCVYLPLKYDRENNKNIPVAYPFSIDAAGIVEHYKPDVVQRRTIYLHEQSGYLIYRKEKKYTLYYWDNKWKKIETKQATEEPVLTFDHVPSNALLLLRPEYSEDKERIFIIDTDGNRHWW